MSLYAAALDDGTLFLSRQVPILFNRDAKPIPTMEILPNSRIRIAYQERDGIKWMTDVQIIRISSPFTPIKEQV